MTDLLLTQLEALSLRLEIKVVEARIALLDAVISAQEDALRCLEEESMV